MSRRRRPRRTDRRARPDAAWLLRGFPSRWERSRCGRRLRPRIRCRELTARAAAGSSTRCEFLGGTAWRLQRLGKP